MLLLPGSLSASDNFSLSHLLDHLISCLPSKYREFYREFEFIVKSSLSPSLLSAFSVMGGVFKLFAWKPMTFLSQNLIKSGKRLPKHFNVFATVFTILFKLWEREITEFHANNLNNPHIPENVDNKDEDG